MKFCTICLLLALSCSGVSGQLKVKVPEGVVAGAPTVTEATNAALEILKAECGKLFSGELCFPEEIIEAFKWREGTDILIGVVFKVCCYKPKATKVSSTYAVVGKYRTNPGFTPLGTSDVKKVAAKESCPTITSLNILTSGDKSANALIGRLDTLESKTSFLSGSADNFFSLEINSKLFVGKFKGDLVSGESITVDVRAKIDIPGTEFQDLVISANTVDGDILCIVK
eukprot:TRINITY_DN16426_c1_g2_i3.p3 TRINITY_DN16426_c1_g2~~TRINITY_DN16426_c1_g2_i3.p3  ORF type:complete len:227 (-),score=19.43 TRINITY_DN16426_c1_g2_i3:360-1040(-)